MNVCEFKISNHDQTFPTEIFMDDFESYKDMSNKYLAESFQTFSGLTADQ